MPDTLWVLVPCCCSCYQDVAQNPWLLAAAQRFGQRVGAEHLVKPPLMPVVKPSITGASEHASEYASEHATSFLLGLG